MLGQHLKKAASIGRISTIKVLLENKNLTLKDKEIALKLAVKNNYLKICMLLIENGAPFKNTWIIANSIRFPDIYNYLLSLGCDPTTSEVARECAYFGIILDEIDLNLFFHHSILLENLDMVVVCLKKGLYRHSEMILAVERNKYYSLKTILDMGYKPIPKALERACFKGDLDIVKMLISYGAKIDNISYRLACENSHFELVEYLFLNGADYKSYEKYKCLSELKNESKRYFKNSIHREGVLFLLDNRMDANFYIIKEIYGNGSQEEYDRLIRYLQERPLEICHGEVNVIL